MQTRAFVLEAAFVLGVVTATDPQPQKPLTGQLPGQVQTVSPRDPSEAVLGRVLSSGRQLPA